MKKSRLVTVAVFAVVFAVMLGLAFSSAAAPSTPVLYRNDAKYTIAEYPAEMINGKLHVPVSFFVGLENIQYEFSSEPAGFYLRNKVTGRFFSFSFDSSGIVVDSSFENVNFPISHSTVYLPLEYCAEILSLKIEKTSDSKTERVRLTDGSHKLTFEELIELYDPTVSPEDPPEIEPEKPAEPITPPTPADRYVYVTVEQMGAEDVSDILDVLDKSRGKVTFFFTEEGIKAHPEAVLRAFVYGHGIGITAEPTEEGLKGANDALYSVLNINTRLYRPTGALDSGTATRLEEMGYVICNYHSDTSRHSAGNAARNVYNETFERETTVIRIPADSQGGSVTEQIFYYISTDEYVIHKILDSTAVIE